MAPAFVLGTWIDSAPHNFAWIEGVAAEMQKGWIYPRWLSKGFDGLGSPSFYFYPPLPFLVMGAVKAMSGSWLSTNALIQGYAFVLLFASGLSMMAWARTMTDRTKALLAGLIYMAMPYHLFNHMNRSAIGEFSIYALLPLLLLAMGGISRGQTFSVPLFAVVFAACILTHLPSSLLICVFVIPVYAVWLNGLSVTKVTQYRLLAVATFLGLALSAAYLVPALTLQDHINAQFWWSGHFDIRNWTIMAVVQVRDHLLTMYASYAVFGLLLIYRWRKMPAGSAEKWRAGFLIIWAWVLMIVITGIVPQIWSGVLAKVQFPWRLLLVVDLLTAIALVLTIGAHRPTRIRELLVFAVLAASILGPDIEVDGRGSRPLYERSVQAHGTSRVSRRRFLTGCPA